MFKDLLTVKNLSVIAATLAVLLIVVALWGNASKAPEPPEIVIVTVEPQSVETPEPTATVSSTVYQDCAEVWAELGRPITADDDGFPKTMPNKFDLDSNGIGCEDNPATAEDESSIDWEAVWQRTKDNAEDFGDWAGPKLESFWDKTLEPTIDTGWNALKDRF